jgi:hypothetical protein
VLDDGITTSGFSWIRDFRPRNIGLTDNIQRDLDRIENELESRKRIPSEARRHLPRILLVLDLNTRTDDYKLLESVSRLMHTYNDARFSVIISTQKADAKLIPGEFRKNFHNNVYLGFINPIIGGFDPYLPEEVRSQLPRKTGMASHTSSDGYEVGLVPNMSKKALARRLEGYCWQ